MHERNNLEEKSKVITAKVSFYGVIKDIVNEPQIEIQIQDEFTLRQLLDNLGEKFGKNFQEGILDKHCGVKSYVRFFVNREPVDNFDLDKKLKISGNIAETAILVLPTQEGGKSLLSETRNNINIRGYHAGEELS